MTIREALLVSAVRRHTLATLQGEDPTGPVDEAMITLGMAALDSSKAVLGEHFPSPEVFQALEQLGAELGIPIVVKDAPE